MDGQSQEGCLWADVRDPAYLRMALRYPWSAGGPRGKLQFQGAVYSVSSWQNGRIGRSLQARFVARFEPDFQAQYRKNIRTYGADVSGCAFPACQPPRVVRCAHTSQAGRPAPWGSNSMDAAGCGRSSSWGASLGCVPMRAVSDRHRAGRPIAAASSEVS